MTNSRSECRAIHRVVGGLCLATSLLIGCKVDDTKRGTATSSASASVAPRSTTSPKSAARAKPRPAPAESWNDESIAWRPVDVGLREAKQSGKPIMVVVYTSWCPHCRNYSRVFADARLVEAAKKFVMIRINQDKDRAESSRFAPDGQYIPRTLFLNSDGKVMPEVRAHEGKYAYFYPEDDPSMVLDAMHRVATK